MLTLTSFASRFHLENRVQWRRKASYFFCIWFSSRISCQWRRKVFYGEVATKIGSPLLRGRSSPYWAVPANKNTDFRTITYFLPWDAPHLMHPFGINGLPSKDGALDNANHQLRKFSRGNCPSSSPVPSSLIVFLKANFCKSWLY